MPIPSPVRAGQEVFAEFFGVGPLGGKVIAQSENGNPFIVQDEGSQGPRGTTIVEVLDDEETMLRLDGRVQWSVIGWTCFLVRALFLKEVLMELEITFIEERIGAEEFTKSWWMHGHSTEA